MSGFMALLSPTNTALNSASFSASITPDIIGSAPKSPPIASIAMRIIF